MMKKLLFAGVIAIISLSPSFGQNNFSIGGHVGIPVGDIEDVSSFEAGVDLAYRFAFVEIVEVGPLVGYTHFFGENDFIDYNYIPLAASGRLSLPSSFFAGFDIGYALALKDEADGGLFYRPQLGYNFMNFGVVLSYAGIAEDNLDLGALTLGFEFKF